MTRTCVARLSYIFYGSYWWSIEFINMLLYIESKTFPVSLCSIFITLVWKIIWSMNSLPSATIRAINTEI